MTELAASAIALMLDVELAVAIACAAAWFELRQKGEGRPAKQVDVGGVFTARTIPERCQQRDRRPDARGRRSPRWAKPVGTASA